MNRFAKFSVGISARMGCEIRGNNIAGSGFDI
jgi:hypothetical protein